VPKVLGLTLAAAALVLGPAVAVAGSALVLAALAHE